MIPTKVTRTNADIQRAVVSALAGDRRLESAGLERFDVQVIDDEVVLQGAVESVWQKRLAEQIARRVAGGRRVVNDLKVHPTWIKTDADIAESIRAVLARDLGIDEKKVFIRCKDAVVQIEGSVDTYALRAAVEEAAWFVGGVLDVVNNLTVVAPPRTMTDERVAANVRTNLERNLKLNLSKVDVHVINGKAYLRGQVSTLIQKVLVEDCAWWTPGVRSVVNDLLLEPGDPIP